jgi:hypothetical protein
LSSSESFLGASSRSCASMDVALSAALRAISPTPSTKKPSFSPFSPALPAAAATDQTRRTPAGDETTRSRRGRTIDESKRERRDLITKISREDGPFSPKYISQRVSKSKRLSDLSSVSSSQSNKDTTRKSLRKGNPVRNPNHILEF